MMKSLFRTVATLIAFIILSPLLISCADNVQPEDNTETTVSAETTVMDEANDSEYHYPSVFYDNSDFRILNESDRYSMIYQLLPEEPEGDSLSSVRHAVNTKIAEKYGLKLSETQIPYSKILKTAQTEVATGTPLHDVFFLTGQHIGTLMNQGYLINLLDIEELHTKEDYWDQALIRDGKLKNKYLYYLSGNYHIQPFECTTCIFFNKTMFSHYELTYPYELVRNNKWTVDKLIELSKPAVNLNGQQTFAYSETGSAMYGIEMITNAPKAFVIGGNAYIVEKDSDGYPIVSFNTEHFQTVAEKIAELTALEGVCDIDHVIPVFPTGRSLFAAAEVKVAANQIVDMEDDFGILPVPKFNEEQSNYVSNLFWGACLMCIPTTCSDVERAGIVMDTLFFEAEKSVLPVYQVRVCYKGLRDQDSVNMLDIINKTRYLDWGLCYNWTTSFVSSLETKLKSGNGNIASIVKSNEKIVEKKIKETMNSLPD